MSKKMTKEDWKALNDHLAEISVNFVGKMKEQAETATPEKLEELHYLRTELFGDAVDENFNIVGDIFKGTKNSIH